MRKLVIFTMLFVLITGILYGENKCSSPPGGEGTPPGSDHPDDGNLLNRLIFKLPDGKGIGIRKIYLNGFAKENAVLMLQTSKDVEFMKEGGLDKPEVLIFPTGSLYGEEGNEALRLSLEEHIKIRNGDVKK